MICFFEELRQDTLKKKIDNGHRFMFVCGVVGLLSIILAYSTSVIFLGITLISFGVAAYKNSQITYLKKIKDDVKQSSFYEKIKQYGISYYDVIAEISNEMQYDCLYQNQYMYITKNWIIDFGTKDISVTHLDQVIWIYEVKLNGVSYVKCHLDDANEFFIHTNEIKKVLTIINNERPSILVGYSRTIEEMFISDKQTFIQNIKNRIYPTMEGNWQKRE